MTFKDMEYNSGILTGPMAGVVLPPREQWETKKNGYVVIECPQRIPCNPCATSCPAGAVAPFKDINDVPWVDYTKCTGCALCVARCPGLACFVIDLTYSENEAIIKLPHEFLPVPAKGEKVKCLDRRGQEVANGTVKAVAEPFGDRTRVVSVIIPKELAGDIRAVKAAVE